MLSNLYQNDQRNIFFEVSGDPVQSNNVKFIRPSRAHDAGRRRFSSASGPINTLMQTAARLSLMPTRPENNVKYRREREIQLLSFDAEQESAL